MRYPWILFALLLLAAALCLLAFWFNRRRIAESTYTVAAASQIQNLGAFKKAKRFTRIGGAVTVAAISLAMISLSITAGAPINRRIENPKLASRDIVLCLDASGSMLPYDGQILDGFRKMAEEFSGERVSLQLWSARTITKFPLTDDYGLIQEELEKAAAVIRDGYLGPMGKNVMVSNRLLDYLEGIDALDGEDSASLIGDGLATCVLSFDKRDHDRSRTVILATDNEVNGPQIYELKEAVALASEQNVNIIGLYPDAYGFLTNDGREMKELIEGAGGEFYEVKDPAAVSGIMANIKAQQLEQLVGAKKVIETDKPHTSLLVAVWCLLIFLAAAAWRRL